MGSVSYEPGEAAQDLVREMLDTVVNGPHGLNPFPQSGFFALVLDSGAICGVPENLARVVALTISEWLEKKGYVTLGKREADDVCDCEACLVSFSVTPSGLAFMAEDPSDN